MKYLKLFEFKIQSKYKVGDYFLLDGEDWICPIVKVLSIYQSKKRRPRPVSKIVYTCQTFNADLTIGEYELKIHEDDSFRKLSDKECEDLELTLTALKYNL